MITDINQTAFSVIKSAISKQKFIQNLLLAGNNQNEKVELAKGYLKAIFCDDIQNTEPCCDCQACRLIEAQQHPDVYWSTRDTKMGKDEIGYLQTRMSESGLLGSRRAYVIEDLSTMTLQAQNAWLKFLEEPLANVYCIAMIENENQILPTVKSRFLTLQVNDVNRLAMEEIPEMFINVADSFLKRYMKNEREIDLLLFLEKNIKINEEGLMFTESLLKRVIETECGLELVSLISRVRKMADANVPKDQLVVYFCLNVYSKESEE